MTFARLIFCLVTITPERESFTMYERTSLLQFVRECVTHLLYDERIPAKIFC
jgi:hypothetical protein